MARVFITGSSDGLGRMAARLLIDQGHDVVLHGEMRIEVATASRWQPALAELSQGTSPPWLGQEQSPTRSTSSAALML